jgi:hypothetical protein
VSLENPAQKLHHIPFVFHHEYCPTPIRAFGRFEATFYDLARGRSFPKRPSGKYNLKDVPDSGLLST